MVTVKNQGKTGGDQNITCNRPFNHCQVKHVPRLKKVHDDRGGTSERTLPATEPSSTDK
jgi:hypothetical protein